MQNKYLKFLTIVVIFLKIFWFNANAETINEIQIKGNDRIADETIMMFSKTNLGDDINENDLNDMLKELYNTNFFETVEMSFINRKLIIKVLENPIIEEMEIVGIKKKKFFRVHKRKYDIA